MTLKEWCEENNREDLLTEWHPTKNGNLTPSDFAGCSCKKVWWVCSHGHEWKSTINNRTTKNSGCPKCSGRGTSLAEQGVAFYLEQVCKVEQRTKVNGQEIDVYLPEYRIGIEYDGIYYHTEDNRDREINKNKMVAEVGVILIRVKESDKNAVENKTLYFKYDTLGDNYAWALNQLGQLLATLTGNTQFNSLKIDTDNDIIKIRERVDLCIKEKSLSVLYPEIAKEWHPEKNGKLTSEMVTPHSNLKAWWKCSLGHEWYALINNRVKGAGCPYCSNKAALKGFNDLATVRPDIAKEWHPTKNNELQPTDFVCGSSQKVWWHCSWCGNEWYAQIYARVHLNSGCPKCSKKKSTVSGRKTHVMKQGSLTEKCPDIAKEWHPTKNNELKPTDVTRGSHKKVWWQCIKGHEWETSVHSRTGNNSGCPYCSTKTKSVTCLDTGTTYNTISEAARILNVSPTGIGGCCKGKLKTAGGYHWKYA